MVNYILKEIKKRKNQKKGISEMISYVLLISIVTFISVAVYVWLRSLNPGETIACDEGTSIILYNTTCGEGVISFTLKNNGLFTINGVVLLVTNNTGREPTIALVSKTSDLSDISSYTSLGYYLFGTSEGLKPNNFIYAIFKNESINSGPSPNDLNFKNITRISIRPFIIDKRKNPILCNSNYIEIPNCNF
jgi:hypothetical protein